MLGLGKGWILLQQLLIQGQSNAAQGGIENWVGQKITVMFKNI